MTDEDVFREAYLAGMTRRELREKFGINDKRIDTLRRKLDLPVRRCVRKAPPEGFEDFAGKPGVSIPMIRQTYGCSEDVASRWVRECGVVLTDLCCSDFGPATPYPTLWVSNHSDSAPWGDVVMMKDEK